MTALLEARGLACGYGQAATIVPSLDLEVHPGEVVALLGANGAGKTTTILTLAGDLPALGGELLWNGQPTAAPLHWRARNGLGLITEERAVLMKLTVAENLRVARCDEERALHLFPELRDHLDRRVGLLSGGQQQMLALAWTLARPTTVLLADELSLGLAPQIVDRLLRAIRDAADTGVGVLLVEQHVHKAMAYADRAYVMQRGRVQLHGTAAELRGRVDEIQASYLSVATEHDAGTPFEPSGAAVADPEQLETS
jgi:branched-chain amino acid transport system ATP-binding protein